MIVNGKDVSIDELLKDEDLRDNFGKTRDNNLFLSDYQIKILERNQINYKNFQTMAELSFEIEEVLNNDSDCDLELEEVSRQIDEYRYYNEIHH